VIAWGGGGAVYVYLCDLCCLVGMVYGIGHAGYSERSRVGAL